MEIEENNDNNNDIIIIENITDYYFKYIKDENKNLIFYFNYDKELENIPLNEDKTIKYKYRLNIIIKKDIFNFLTIDYEKNKKILGKPYLFQNLKNNFFILNIIILNKLINNVDDLNNNDLNKSFYYERDEYKQYERLKDKVNIIEIQIKDFDIIKLYNNYTQNKNDENLILLLNGLEILKIKKENYIKMILNEQDIGIDEMELDEIQLKKLEDNIKKMENECINEISKRISLEKREKKIKELEDSIKKIRDEYINETNKRLLSEKNEEKIEEEKIEKEKEEEKDDDDIINEIIKYFNL